MIKVELKILNIDFKKIVMLDEEVKVSNIQDEIELFVRKSINVLFEKKGLLSVRKRTFLNPMLTLNEQNVLNGDTLIFVGKEA